MPEHADQPAPYAAREDPFVLADARASSEERGHTLDAALADVQARLEIARQGRDLLAERLAQAEEAAAAQRRGLEEEQLQARRRAEELAASEQRLVERTAALEEQAARGRAAEQRLRELESTVARLESELEGARAGRELAVAEAALLRAELARARSERAALVADLEALREELGRLTAATEEQERRLGEARDAAAGAAAAEQRAQALRDDRDELQAALGEALAALERQRARVEAQDAELSTTAAARAEAAEVACAREAELSTLRGAHGDVEALTAERDALLARAEASEAQVTELAEQSVALREAVDGALADPARTAARPAPPVGHPALAVVPDAPDPSGSVVVDLARAAERLRAQAPAPGEDEEVVAEPDGAVDGEPDRAVDGEVGPEPEAEAAAEPGPAPAAVAFAPPVARDPVPAEADVAHAPGSSEPEPGGAFELPTRAASAPPGRVWLGRALAEVAERDPIAGTRLLLAGLAAQGPRIRKPLRYALDLGPQGCHVVDLDGLGGAHAVAATPAELDDVAFTITGSPAALAPLAAGGGLRLDALRVEGGRRGRRRLRKAVREPQTLGSWTAASVRADPRDLLDLVGAALGPEPGLEASLAVETPAGRDVLLVTPGEPAHVSFEQAEAEAVLRPPDGDLLGVLAGRLPARGTGDPAAVARVLEALDAR